MYPWEASEAPAALVEGVILGCLSIVRNQRKRGLISRADIGELRGRRRGDALACGS
ncbi:hypothetical protein RCH17_003551 [Arthrobacter sp. MP_M7]|nr:hypothetical protein [Arthrobacter sp. MP_M4]MEC5204719.1 hypothetical protein [Arthrobacter sp. MP_M7]